MYTLKGIFPEPKKEQKKNFIKENKKQLKYLQAKSPKDPPKFTLRSVHPPPRFTPTGLPGNSLNQVKSVTSQPSSKSAKNVVNTPKTNLLNPRKKCPDVKIKKGDMAEFLKRRELRQSQAQPESADDNTPDTGLPSHLRDMACQTLESDLSLSFAKSTKLTTLHPKPDDDSDSKLKASGDAARHQTSQPSGEALRRAGDSDLFEAEKRSRLNAILERKDPYLPSGYQKGVVPKYLRERKEQELKEPEAIVATADCPAGHVALPDMERRETLRMLRSSFADLVSELNKMPVKTDTLRMRNRKMELEKQLSKLEEGIKVFSRPKVFVKIGE